MTTSNLRNYPKNKLAYLNVYFIATSHAKNEHSNIENRYMKKNEHTEPDLPRQYTGKALDYYNAVELSSQEEAISFFDQVRRKLLDVNQWHKMSAGPSAEFCIKDSAGEKQDRYVQKTDRIRIDIPGPGLPSSQGYDWVEVEEILEEHEAPDYQKIVLTLRPCPDPTNPLSDTAHFFKAVATSNFLIERKGTQIYLHYAGRNELVNIANKSNLDNLRNFFIGLTAKVGASFPQWKAVIDGLAQRD